MFWLQQKHCLVVYVEVSALLIEDGLGVSCNHCSSFIQLTYRSPVILFPVSNQIIAGYLDPVNSFLLVQER